jgi:hypothetical protein
MRSSAETDTDKDRDRKTDRQREEEDGDGGRSRNRSEEEGVIDGPRPLGSEANARAIRPPARVSAPETCGRRPGGADEEADRKGWVA